MDTNEHLETIANDINENFSASFLSKLQQLSSYDFLLGFSRGKSKNLIISINLNNPFVLISEDKFLQNQNGSFFQRIKAKLFNAFFKEATLLNNDNILCLKFIKTNDTYDKISYDLVIELFKNNTNMIILSNGKIEEAFKLRGLDSHHPILTNLSYVYPDKANFFKEFNSDEKIKILNYYKNINTKYLEEKYRSLIVLLKRKKKSLNKKFENLKIEKEEAISHQEYKEYGDYLKMNFSNYKKGDTDINLNGVVVPLKNDYTPAQNLQYFYKVYKKSKATIEATTKYLIETQNEIQYIDNILSSIDTYSEDEYAILINEISQNKIVKYSSNKGIKLAQSAKKPYFILYGNTKFGYGKNNVQNNELTFNIANKNYWFLHISKAHGPHIVIFKEDPTDNEIQFACELALYLAKAKDGEVIYSSIKELRKTPNLGQVKLNKYETYHINKIRDNMIDYVEKSSRF